VRTGAASPCCGKSGSASAVQGFTLIEALIAMCILTFGLLAAGQIIYVALSSASLARSQGSAAIVAQGKLAFLADLYGRDPNAEDLSIGGHGPEQVEVVNPAARNVLNRYSVTWTVSTVSDHGTSRVITARLVLVTVTPVDTAGSAHFRASLNKIVTVPAIFSPRISL
jgi:type II secretory pathway pseudopilin PulG